MWDPGSYNYTKRVICCPTCGARTYTETYPIPSTRTRVAWSTPSVDYLKRVWLNRNSTCPMFCTHFWPSILTNSKSKRTNSYFNKKVLFSFLKKYTVSNIPLFPDKQQKQQKNLFFLEKSIQGSSTVVCRQAEKATKQFFLSFQSIQGVVPLFPDSKSKQQNFCLSKYTVSSTVFSDKQ